MVSIDYQLLAPQHTFELFYCLHYGQQFFFGYIVFSLRLRQFPAEKREWPIRLCDNRAQLGRTGVGVHFEDFVIVWIGQDHILSDGSLYGIECF